MATQIPGYTVIRNIGSGGSADVYLAVQENLNRRVAPKLLKGALVSDPNFGERFKREGRIIAQLNHPHIIPVYDIGEYDGHYYMAMEYLSGGDLRSQAEQLTLNDLLQVVWQMTQALKLAHDRGFVHRDIKPTNILFRNPTQAVLTDFGIARQAESLTQMTVTGALLGTPAYMSPEQIGGKTLDGRADLYSLGVTLFELLTGYLPYRGEGMINVVMQHVNAEIPLLPESTSRLQSLINKLLAKPPQDRFTNAAALERELQKFIDQPETRETPLTTLWPETPPEPGSDAALTKRSWRKRTRITRLTASLLVAGLAAVGLGSWYATDSLRVDDNPNQTVPRVGSQSPGQTGNSTGSNEPAQAQAKPPWQDTLSAANQLSEEGQLMGFIYLTPR